LVLLAVFILVTNPTAAHVIAKAAYKTGVKPVLSRRLADDD
jgi:monovalent cation/proton antiporter MnhG/PhaG subunit